MKLDKKHLQKWFSAFSPSVFYAALLFALQSFYFGICLFTFAFYGFNLSRKILEMLKITISILLALFVYDAVKLLLNYGLKDLLGKPEDSFGEIETMRRNRFAQKIQFANFTRHSQTDGKRDEDRRFRQNAKNNQQPKMNNENA